MKKLMLTLLTGILMFSVADAQSRGRGPEDKHPKMERDSHHNPQAHIDKIIEAIDAKTPLTDAEKEGLNTIFMDFHTAMRGGPENMQAAVQKRNESARALLSDEKYIAYLEVLTEMMPMHRRGHMAGGAAKAEHMIKALDEKVGLTVEEKQGLRDIFREFHEAIEADPDNRKKAVEERDKKVEALLPKEKYDAYLELKSEMKMKHKEMKDKGKNKGKDKPKSDEMEPAPKE